MSDANINNHTDLILSNIQSGVFVIDADTHTIVDVNPAAAAMIGRPRSQIVGNVCHNFVCPSERGCCPLLEQGGSVHEVETVLTRPDGVRREILKTAAPVVMDGRDYIVESFVDITDRKRAEAAALAHQERFKVFFSSVRDAIFVHPLLEEGFAPFIEVNDIACERYGYTREEFLRLTAPDITKREDALIHASRNQRQRLLSDRHLVFETVHIRKSGEEFPVEINSNIVEQFGKPVIIAVVRDISERKRAEEEKARIEDQYRQAQKVEAIGRLAGGVAHDLNNLLTPVIGYSEMLAQESIPAESRMFAINQIVKAGHGARDLVRQLLAFSRKQTLEYRTLNLNEAVQEFEGLLRRTIRENIELVIETADEMPVIRADVGQIEQVIMNLSVNAQDAMPDGGRLTIAVAVGDPGPEHANGVPAEEQDRYACLTIHDTGNGMDSDVLEHAFEPFYSTKGERGTGLGLATVYGVVKQHGGNVDVRTRVGAGTSISVYLPLASADDKDIQAALGTAPELRGTETILLVEDNEHVRNLGQAILERKGYTLLVARDGAEAVALLHAHPGPVDLLLTDVVMPDMNGREVYEQAVSIRPGIRVLYMSGYTDDVIAHHGVLDPDIQFIQKPFTVEALATRVREALDD